MYQQIKTSVMQLKENPDSRQIISPEEIARVCDDLKTASQEHLIVITSNTKNRMIDKHLVGLGVLDSTLMHPREVFRPAVLDAASGIIIVHNHPSGDPSPSSQDIRITRKMIDSGKILGIPVLDHVIVAKEGFSSLRESGLIDFSTK